jgi:hypothetical protein
MEMPVIPARSLLYPAITLAWIGLVGGLVPERFRRVSIVAHRIGTYVHEGMHAIGGFLATGWFPEISVGDKFDPTMGYIGGEARYSHPVGFTDLGATLFLAFPKLLWVAAVVIALYPMQVPQPLPYALGWGLVFSICIHAGLLSYGDLVGLPILPKLWLGGWELYLGLFPLIIGIAWLGSALGWWAL